MAKKKKGFPNKPKASSTLETKKRWLERVAEIKKENAQIEKDNKASKELTKKIRKMRP